MSPVSQAAHHAPLPVEVGELPDERLPDYMVLVLHFVIAEALAGARSAHARQARVDMSATTKRLTVEVSDDGCEAAAADRAREHPAILSPRGADEHRAGARGL